MPKYDGKEGLDVKEKKRIGNIAINAWFLSVMIFLSAWNADRFVNMVRSELPQMTLGTAKEFIGNWETYYTEYFRHMEPLAEIGGVSYLVLDKWSVDNYSYMKDGEGNVQLLEDNFDRALAEERMLRISEAFKKRDIPLVYISLPPRFDKEDFKVAQEMDFFGQRDERMLALLSEAGVDTLDAGGALRNAGQRYLYPFKTDIHLETEGEYETARLLAEKLSSMGIEIAEREVIFDKSNYTVASFPFAGNLVKSSGSTYTWGKDSFELWYPVFETDFTVVNPERNRIREGSFAESIMNGYDAPVSLADNPNPYWVTNYLQYPSPFYTIENNKLENGCRLLFIIDSYAMRTVSFLSLGAKHITVIDPRGEGSGRSDGKGGAEYLANAIEAGEYDAVIIAAGGWDFYKSIE